MPAWVEDAQQLTEAKELTSSQNSVLLRTPEVEEFLSNVNLPSHALVAPKGFGKTFVLKLKRLSLQEAGYKCLPLSPIVDRPMNKPPILPDEKIDILEHSDNWGTLWNIAFSLCLIKSLQEDQDIGQQLKRLLEEDNLPSGLFTILTHPYINRPFDILHDCLASQRSELYLTMAFAQPLTRIYSTIHKRLAIFVDNIDEYLQHYINFSYSRREDVQEKFVRIWHAGQIGAWVALRRLHGINPHVRIFVSIRKEAYHYAAKHEAEFSNLRSFRRELRYRREDIKQIIENNVSVTPRSELVDKNNQNLIVRFLGRDNEFIANVGTAKQEPVINYWIRHCSLRPRDAVTIGKEISLIRGKDRTQHSIRAAINTASAESVETLFNEVAPFYDSLYPDLFPSVITSNVITYDEINRAAAEYTQLASRQYGVETSAVERAFPALYGLGLIGVVQDSRDDPGTLVQRFSAFGELSHEASDVLPKAEIYLVHPAFSDFIVRRNVGFLRELNKHNVVGDALEWRPEESIRFVVIGDIRGYNERILQTVGGSQTFHKYWRSVFNQFAADLDYAALREGDKLLLADRSPMRLLHAARALNKQLGNSGYELSLRIGGHSGFWRLNVDLEGVQHPEVSDIIGIAARIEPIAKPRDIVVSQRFIDDARRCGYDIDRESPRLVTQEYVGADRYDSQEGVLISKEGMETPRWMHLYVFES
jgi:class 3 adenylate cyclase